jgi:hypothetical protein
MTVYMRTLGPNLSVNIVWYDLIIQSVDILKVAVLLKPNHRTELVTFRCNVEGFY